MDDDPYVYRETGWFGRDGYFAYLARLLFRRARGQR